MKMPSRAEREAARAAASAAKSAADVDYILLEAGWSQADNKRTPGGLAPFLQGSPALFVINGVFDGVEYAVGGGANQAHTDPVEAARYLIGIGLAERASRLPQPRFAPLPYADEEPDDPPQPAEPEPPAEPEAPQQLPPNPSEAKLSDYGEVGAAAPAAPAAPDPAENDIGVDDLIAEVAKSQIAAQSVIAKLSGARRVQITELLMVEKVELRNKRNVGQATEEDEAREKDVDRLLNLFARVGEM